MSALTGNLATLVIAALTATVVLAVAAVAARAPLLRRMGTRQMIRRPARTATIVAGLSLSTVFITAVFGLQDSLHASAVTYRAGQVGRIDEAVTGTFTQTQVAQALARLGRSPEVKAAAALTMTVGATLNPPGTNTPPISAYVYSVPPGFDQVYGPLTDTGGHTVRVADLLAGQVLVSRSAAARAGLHPGQSIRLQLDQLTLTETVAAVLGNDPVFVTGELNQDIAVAGVFAASATVQQAYTRQYHHALPMNTIAVANARPGAGGSRDVLRLLQSIFAVAPLDPAAQHGSHAPIYFDETLIHPLQPTVVNDTSGLSLISSKAEYLASPAARQATWLQPAFTVLLVGSGLLLLMLQCLLLAGERRAELAMSRAQGLQRRQAAIALVIEGCGYALAATVSGIPIGAAATAGEIALLNRLPRLSLGSSAIFQFGTVHFQAALRWQSALDSAGLSIFAALLVVATAAAWTTRANIVTAIRNLDDPPNEPAPLAHLLRDLVGPPRTTGHRRQSESAARRRERRRRAATELLGGVTRRGLLPLALGGTLLVSTPAHERPQTLGMTLVDAAAQRTLAISLLIVGAPLLLRWAATAVPRLTDTANRLTLTAMGTGLLLYGLHAGQVFLRAIFVSDLQAAGIHQAGPYSLTGILMYLLLPLAGLLIITTRNADLPAAALTRAARRIPTLAPIGRIGLAHALTYRTRTGVTVTLLSTITYLIMLLVTNNTTTGQQATDAGPYTGALTAFLTSYLALGLVFGIFAIGIVASRAVVERRQQIGMLRALGFSRGLVRRAFLLEASFVIVLGLLPAASLAWWLVARVAHTPGQNASFPVLPVAALLLGAYLAALAATIPPARTAARVPPAEALRWE